MTDQIDPNLIDVTGGSPDVRSWPVTATILSVELTPQELRFTSSPLAWPHVTPPGWDGGIQSTLWIVVQKEGQWRATGSIEFYHGRIGTGSPLSSALADWWYYAPEIGQPQPGETVGLFIAAGDQRRKDVRSVEERSNIVTFTVPPNDSGSFTYGDVPAPPVPQPEPTPVPPGNVDVRTQLDRIEAAMAAERAENQAFREEARAFVRNAAAVLLPLLGKPS